MVLRPSASLALAVVYGVTFAVASMVAAPDRLILGAVLAPVLITSTYCAYRDIFYRH